MVQSDTANEQTYSLTATLPAQAIANKVAFGFAVPFISEMPPNVDSLTDDQLQAWLDKTALLENGLKVKVYEPKVTFNLKADKKTGTTVGCGRLEGWIMSQIFIDMAANEAPALKDAFEKTILPKYEDASRPGQIQTVLSLEFSDGTFADGVTCTPNPCAKTVNTCNGNVLEMAMTDAECTLPKPSTYKDGGAIGAVCGKATTNTWKVDCAELGGTCKSGACSVAWATPQAGDLVLSEIFYGAGSETEAWLELTNISSKALKLNDCYIQARPNGAMGAKVTIRAAGPVVVGSRQTYLISRDKMAEFDSDFYTNPPGDVYFRMSNEQAFRLVCNNEVIDNVIWKDWTITPGTAMQLSSRKLNTADNDNRGNWCNATKTYGTAGKKGTPGATNDACP